MYETCVFSIGSLQLDIPTSLMKPRVAYGFVHLDWKLQNNREKSCISRKKVSLKSVS